MNTHKYKENGNGWFTLTTITESGETITSPSFNQKNSPDLYAEMMARAAEGVVIEPQFTELELEAKEQAESDAAAVAYVGLRKSEYPDPMEYNDAMVKQWSEDETIRAEGQVQMEKYFSDCLAVKAKYLKP